MRKHYPAMSVVEVTALIEDDALVEVEVTAERVGNSSIVIGFKMRNIRTEETAGRGSFTYVFVDKQTRKSRPMPADFKASVLARHPELT